MIVSIHENRTLSAAARRLGLNQSTVSRILKRIESRLGLPLFLNASGTYELTSEGEAYFRTGKQMEQAVSELGMSRSDPAIQGTLRLTMIEALVGYLVGRIGEFNREFPRIRIELNGSNQNKSLPRREFHAALRLDREEAAKSLLIKKLGEFGISGYQRRGGTASSEWIGYESSLASIPEEKWLRSRAKTSGQRLRVSSYATMERAIALGLGTGLLPRFMGDLNPDLHRVTGDKPVLKRPIWFMTHPDFRQDPAMRSFSTWLFQLFEKDRSFLHG